MIAKTVTNPLDRIRMLSQTGEHGAASGAKLTPFQLYRSIIKNEGVLGLWAGNGANLLRVFPSKSIVFSSNDFYRGCLGQWYWGSTEVYSEKSYQLPWSLSFMAGGLSGMSASAATYPLDLARGRITGKLAGPGGKKHYKGIINTVLVTAREEGPRALYKGVTPTLLGAMPYEGIKFGTVGILERVFPKNKDNTEGGSIANNVTRKLMFGGAGGATAGVLTYPNDTVRRLLQLQGSKGTTDHYSGYWDCVRKTYAKFGLERFYRGAFINIIRMAPNTAIQFGSYELLKQYTASYF
eukprot:CAMPEP_0181097458 /NCGR_PEP_ID=MMETSP1071-20121207/11579_1 /TAXON_ID=35127 /ORGANISM="Thalassiosira sp., Strain NH16" /LENGTH=294 /DNA_ID=CAMNT_0023179939 /DNA_START=362 /DNA_END=1246 /DNA_ORIENTATION=+